MHVMLVPAAFCQPLAGSAKNLSLVTGKPECGERELENAEFVRGRVLLLQRGRTTFAQKYLLAQRLQAAALIVAQTLDVWPFVMTDSTGELEAAAGAAAKAEVPCFMISKAVARLLQTLYARAPLGPRSDQDDITCPSGLLLTTREPTRECSICQEAMAVGQAVLKLHCRHVYHDTCLATWLRTKNTCPLCREELPAEKMATQAQQARTTAAGEQQYYV